MWLRTSAVGVALLLFAVIESASASIQITFAAKQPNTVGSVDDSGVITDTGVPDLLIYPWDDLYLYLGFDASANDWPWSVAGYELLSTASDTRDLIWTNSEVSLLPGTELIDINHVADGSVHGSFYNVFTATAIPPATVPEASSFLSFGLLVCGGLLLLTRHQRPAKN